MLDGLTDAIDQRQTNQECISSNCPRLAHLGIHEPGSAELIGLSEQMRRDEPEIVPHRQWIIFQSSEARRISHGVGLELSNSHYQY